MMIGLSPEQRSLERPIATAGQLLVEGRVPEMFFREMIAAYGLAQEVEARTFGDIGKNNLQLYIEMFSQKAAFKERVKRVGIIRDAEASSANAAFQCVQAALGGANLPIPKELCKLEGDSLSLGIFILPNCQDSGMLETLCLSAASEVEGARPTPVLRCVDEFFGCLNGNPKNPTKARFAAYALACDVIDPQLGRAAQKGAIPWHAKVFDPLKAFLIQIAGK